MANTQAEVTRGSPVLSCDRGPYRGQRLLDLVVVALVAVPVVSVGLVCALAIKATSRGPVFFRQQRVGMGGRSFEVVKFRTMLVGDNPLIPDASRITLAGRFLRRLSLDELPQWRHRRNDAWRRCVSGLNPSFEIWSGA